MSDNRKVVVSYSPFRVDFMIDETAVVTLNAQGLLEFEHYREKRLVTVSVCHCLTIVKFSQVVWLF